MSKTFTALLLNLLFRAFELNWIKAIGSGFSLVLTSPPALLDLLASIPSFTICTSDTKINIKLTFFLFLQIYISLFVFFSILLLFKLLSRNSFSDYFIIFYNHHSICSKSYSIFIISFLFLCFLLSLNFQLKFIRFKVEVFFLKIIFHQ